MTRMEQVKALRDAADSLEAAQRAHNHVWATLAAWDEMSDDEKRESLITALGRMDQYVTADA